MKLFAASTVLLAALAATSAGAVTITPGDTDITLTEDNRVFAFDGTDISSSAAETGNIDIDRFRVRGLGDDQTALLAGRLDGSGTDRDRDRWVFRNVSGLFTVDLLNLQGSTAIARSAFDARFIVRVDGTNIVNSRFLGPIGATSSASLFEQTLSDSTVVIVARNLNGAADYDLGVALTSVPLPASSLLLLGGVAGLGAVARRKRRR